jgi:hypothetical protein
MDLPRFTSGAVGKLTFSHLNEAFDAIDDIARDAGVSESGSSIRGRVILARTFDHDDDRGWAWVELEGPPYEIKPNGKSSALGEDRFAYPILSYGGISPSVPTDLLIFPKYKPTGELFYVPIISPQTTFPAMILGSESIGGQRFLYTVEEVRWNQTLNGWEPVPDGRTGSAYNGAEAVQDESGPNGSIGVGGCKGPTMNLVRRAIRTGIVVMTSADVGGTLSFSLANGYCWECA